MDNAKGAIVCNMPLPTCGSIRMEHAPNLHIRQVHLLELICNLINKIKLKLTLDYGEVAG